MADTSGPYVVCASGHRPDKLGGYGMPVRQELFRLAVDAIKFHSPSKVVSGMALGWDSAIANAAIRLGVPLVAAVPFLGQESRWPEWCRQEYEWLLRKAVQVVTVSPGGYSAAKLHKRNEWMVDNSDRVLALWNGKRSGTSNCIDYAHRRHKLIHNFWSEWLDRKAA